jgi:dihydroorotate dehydrogenase electron transfer subunit
MSETRGQFQAVVAANVPLCREHFRLVLRLAHFPATEPGQFVQVACRDLNNEYCETSEYDWTPGERPPIAAAELLSPLAMLRRPFSLAGRRDTADGIELDLIHRVVGVGTDWLSRLQPGDRVFVLGPLGNRFQLPADDGIALLIGGGVGIPPMIYLAEKLQQRRTRAVVFAGAVTRDLLALTLTDGAPVPNACDVDPRYNIAEFSNHGIPAVITTDDGSYGFRGYVTQALEAYLDKSGIGRADKSPTAKPLGSVADGAGVILYTCGPEPMMRRVADIAERRGLQCQIAVERAMACGMGTCQSCCIKVKKPDPGQPPMPGRDWAYRLACTDGPVFRSTDLLW